VFNPRNLALALYTFIGVMLFSNFPYNEYTIGKITLMMVVYVAGLVFLLGSHIILPSIKRTWKLGGCTVYKSRYVVCEKPGSAEKVGWAFVKVVPEQPIADMEKERREVFLQTTQGLLAGTQFEAMACYFTVRDRYGENIKRRLEREKNKLTTFAPSGTLKTRDMLERIQKEMDLLRTVPVILEGFYIAGVRDYGYTDSEIVRKLEADVRALAARLAGIGVHAEVVKGNDLRYILDFLPFGSLVQITW